MTNKDGPSGRGFYIAITNPEIGVVRVSTHGLMRDRVLDYADHSAAIIVARRLARESGLYIHDYVRRRQNGEPRRISVPVGVAF